ncbi:MAG TPA: hypothetical protein VJ397_05340 [Thermoplasmata archaeon]|nr:hypothetical protein [Thermoplasmata archaeon]
MLRPKKLPKEEPPFARRTRPTPQATRLLVTSTLTGVILIVVLAIVFLPVLLRQEGKPPVPIVTLRFDASPSWHAVVDSVSFAAPVARFSAELREGPAILVNATALADLEGPPLAFLDADGDGNLTAGDTFSLSGNPAGSYSLHVYYTTGERVGFVEFP